MPISICPRCNTRYTYTANSGDYVHNCSSAATKTLQNEDIVVTGDYEDYAGSGTMGPSEVRNQGAYNKLFGTRAAIEGDNFDGVTRRGNRASTHRQRKHLAYIEEPGNGKNK